MQYEEPEKLALREYLVQEYKEESLYMDDIEQLSYDFYGALVFSWNDEEYTVAQENKNIECLIDWIEEQKALMKQFPSFDPDVDVEEDPCNGRECTECEIGGCDGNGCDGNV